MYHHCVLSYSGGTVIKNDLGFDSIFGGKPAANSAPKSALNSPSALNSVIPPKKIKKEVVSPVKSHKPTVKQEARSPVKSHMPAVKQEVTSPVKSHKSALNDESTSHTKRPVSYLCVYIWMLPCSVEVFLD